MKEIIINENDAGQRADKFILKAFKDLPKSMLYKAIRKKDIKVNKKRIEASFILSEGDVLSIYLDDKFLGITQKEITNHLDIKSYIAYEDENIIILNKPVNVSMHGDGKDKTGLVGGLLHYLYQKGEYDPKKENSFSPAFCNRIDKNTTGLIIGAKNASSLREINKLIQDGLITKKYLCVADGICSFNEEKCICYHTKNEKSKKAILSVQPKEGYKVTETIFTTLETANNMSLIEATLITGRFHQIRAQLSLLGHPLAGDVKYGGKRSDMPNGYILCSYKLKFATTEGLFSYLSGKEFTICDKRIYKYFNRF